MTDDWPIIQLQPGPTDAELEVDRNIKHAIDVAMFDAEECNWDYIPPWAVRG